MLLCAWMQLASAQKDQPEPVYNFQISRGSLLAVVRQFSEQTEIQVSADFGSPETEARVIEEFSGFFTGREALSKILAETGLATEWRGFYTVRIHPAVAPRTVAPRAEDNVQEVLVTGSRLSGGEGPAPVRVYTRKQIDQLGISTVPGLAQYFTQQSFSFGEWGQRSGAQHFQMRGLGVDTTLVLINGRRAAPSATSVTLNAFDLNTIPLTAVDRIEVMSDSASAIYGSDAIGGVVNIILKRDIESPEVYLHYGGSAGGGDERRLAGSLGKSGERYHTALTVDYFDRGMLVGAERDLWRNQDFRRFGGRDYRVPTANPANVYSLTNAPLPGLPASQASVPVGSTGVGLRPEDFLATAGVMSLENFQQTWSILPDLERLSAFGSAEFSLNKSLSIFGEMLLTRSDVVAHGNLPFLSRQIVPAANPYNPFGQAVAVDYSMVGMEPIAFVTQSELARFVLGARGELGRWDWELAYTYSDERVDSERANDLDPMRVRAALDSTDPQTALNLFADGPAGDGALLSSLIGQPQTVDYASGGEQLSAYLRRKLFRMPGGIAEFVVGGEWRQEQLKFLDATPLEAKRDITSGFAEVRLPLLNEVSFKVALRGDYYENAGDSVNPQYGLTWRPVQDWLVRAAYGTSFRPPSLPELASRRLEIPFIFADPRRGGTLSPVRFTTGGNPDLDNISARSFTGGLAYRSDDGLGLHAGIHYWRVSMDNRIVAPRISDLARLEEVMPGRVTRLPATEADISAGWPGALQSLDFSLLNYGRLETSGIDLDLSYRTARQSGDLQAALSATWVDEYVAHDLNSALPVDRVGIANLQGTIPKWRLVGSLIWEGRGWGTSTTATFTPRYYDADLTSVLKRYVASRTIVDMQAWLDLDSLFEPGLFDDLRLTAGALNLFDREADFANVGLTAGFDISQADLKERFVYFRLTKSF